MKKWKILTLLSAFFILSILASGCQSKVFNSLFAQQSWSENYATGENVECSSHLMIDGDVNTVGTIAARDIFLTLPQRKAVHRIVLRNTNVKDLVVYASTGGEGSWKRVGKVSSNQKPTVDLRISATATDKFRFTVMATNEDQLAPGEYSYDVGRITGYIKRAQSKIGELELYGFSTPEE